MYSYSPTLSQISLKNSFGKVVFQILAKIEMTRNKNRLFGGQKSQIWVKFSKRLKFLDFAKFQGLQDLGGQKS